MTRLFTIPAAGGPVTPLAPSHRGAVATSWSASGVIAFLEGRDIWTVIRGQAPVRFLATSANEQYATVSPDGRWMAYTSDQGGREEVYVRPYPGPDPAVQISAGGATSPAWSPDGRRLYFLQGLPAVSTPSMMAVEVLPGSTFRAGRATQVMPWRYGTFLPVTGFDVARDGSFLTVATPDGSAIANSRTRNRVGEMHLVLNFLDELRARVPR